MTALLAAALLLNRRLADDSNGVPQALLSSLTTGVNVTRWFCYVPAGDQSEHFANYLGEADYKTFARLGVKFVRLCISPDIIYSDGKPSDKLAAVDAAIAQLSRHHITAIWDLHDNGQLGLDKPGKDNSGLVSFWSAVAQHYKGSHYSDLVFEVVNEPVFMKNPEVWYPLQAQAVQAIRAQDPARTIMVTSTYWSSIDTLQKMSVLPEKNLVYTFHCYDPFFFTHQGAEWIDEIPKNLKAMPFPSSAAAVAKIASDNDPKYSATLADYGRQHYNDAYLLARLKTAADWGATNHVPVVLGEFGAYPKTSLPDSRGRWFAGMKSAISTLKLPNAIWGYDEGLGLSRTVGSDGAISLDPITLRNFYNLPPAGATAQTKPKMHTALVALALASSSKTAPVRAAHVPVTPKRVVVWDGEAHSKGSSWVNPTTSTFLKTEGDAHSGKTALELKFHDKQNWIGCGFDWFDWKAGRTIGTDTSKMTNLNFWIKTTGLTEDFQLQLLCNGDVIDTPEHHAPKMSIAKYCPNFRDGKWHEVVIPLRDMVYPKGYDPKVVTMIDFGFYTQNEATGSILIDDLAFDTRPVAKKPSK